MTKSDMSFVDQIRAAAGEAADRVGHNELARRCDIDRGNLHNFIAGKIWIGEEKLNRLAAELGLRVTKRRAR